MKLIKTRDYIIILAIAIFGLIIGAFFDFDISKALYANSNLKGLGVILSNYLIVPFITLALSIAMITFVIVIKKDNKIRIPGVIVIPLAGLFILYEEYDKVLDIKEFYGKVWGYINVIVVILLSIVVAAIIAYKMLKKYDHNKLFYASLFAAISIIVAFGIMISLKYIASRPRPWYIFGDYKTGAHTAEFREFYEFQPFELLKSEIGKEYFKSFPSNHVNSTLMVMPTVFMYVIVNDKLNNNKYKTIFTYSFLALGLLIAFTRIIAGAHFISDVSFALIVSFTVVFLQGIALEWINNKYNLFNNENDQSIE